MSLSAVGRTASTTIIGGAHEMWVQGERITGLLVGGGNAWVGGVRAQINDDAIDLGEMMREQFILALPMKPLCREACAVLCPVCQSPYSSLPRPQYLTP